MRESLEKLSKLSSDKVVAKLHELDFKHSKRRSWVWFELGYSPLSTALPFLCKMTEITTESFPSLTINDIKEYYVSEGYQADQCMRKAMASVKTDKDRTLIKSIFHVLYSPWLESITLKFQSLVAKDASIFTNQTAITESETFVLFVDAFRFELAKEFMDRLLKINCQVNLDASWSAIPTVTPTAKPNVSPMAPDVSLESEINEFRPQLKNGKDLQTATFKESLKSFDFNMIKSGDALNPGKKYWQEIGDIDKKGHEEQAGMVKRINELFDYVQEVINNAFEKGVRRIKIVTDHGWLLLPGGLPKTQLNEGLTETRWGRCVLIKEGAKSDLLHLPWRWNPLTFIAYAPGLSFFKANQEYAHGGISLQECLLPVMIVENPIDTGLVPKIKAVKWVNLKCAIETENAGLGCSVDIRTKFSDETTSIVISRIKEVVDNKGSLMVSEDAESHAATVVLIDDTGRIRDKKATTVGE